MLIVHKWGHNFGELAQLAERVLSMHEVAGSIPAFSNENRVYQMIVCHAAIAAECHATIYMQPNLITLESTAQMETYARPYNTLTSK